MSKLKDDVENDWAAVSIVLTIMAVIGYLIVVVVDLA